MKHFFSCFLILTVLIPACKKNNDSGTPPPGISAVINGKYLTFNSYISAGTPGRSGSMYFSGNCDSLAFNSLLSIKLLSTNGTLKPGLYTGPYFIGTAIYHCDPFEVG